MALAPQALSVQGGIEALLSQDETLGTEVVSEKLDEEQEQPDADLAEAESNEPTDDSQEAGDEEDLEAQAEGDEDEGDDDSVDEDIYSVKIDGVEKEVSATELVRGYQLEQASRKRMEEAASVRAEADAQVAATSEQRNKYAEGLAALDKLLAQDMKEVPESLWDEDPIEAARLSAQNDRMAKQRQAIQAEQQQTAQTYLAEQHRLIPEQIPEWSDTIVRDKERAEISRWAKVQGFTDDELKAASDARLVKVLRKAWLFDQSSDKVQIARKKVSKAPKMSRGKARRNSADASATQAQRLESKLNKTHKMGDAVDLLIARGS